MCQVGNPAVSEERQVLPAGMQQFGSSRCPSWLVGTAEEATFILLLCWPDGVEWRDLHYPVLLSVVVRVPLKNKEG